MTKQEIEFQKAVLERLDKIISLFEKDKNTAKMLLEDIEQNEITRRTNYEFY